jgi:predicted S18 family serine protease
MENEQHKVVALTFSALIFGILLGSVATYLFVSSTASTVQSQLFNAENHFSDETEIRTATVPLLAVSGIDSKGVIYQAEISILPGNGKVESDQVNVVNPYTQLSAEVAVRAAESALGMELKNYDIHYRLLNKEIQAVSGSSGGAALAVALVAAMQRKKILEDVYITGTILPDGSISSVGGILEKGIAAANAGGKTFFIPYEKSKIIVYYLSDQNTNGQPTLVPVQIDLKNFFNQRYGMKVSEVRHINEIIAIAFE